MAWLTMLFLVFNIVILDLDHDTLIELECSPAVLAGRQLALAILMHDASHNSLFKTKWMNDYLVDWLCARPIWNDVHKYRAHHTRHHAKTSTPEDPDLTLVAGFPTTKTSLTRKFLRDLVGITGFKFTVGRILMDAEVLKWTVANDLTVELPYWEDKNHWILRLNTQWQYASNSNTAIRLNWDYEIQNHLDWMKSSLGYVWFF